MRVLKEHQEDIPLSQRSLWLPQDPLALRKQGLRINHKTVQRLMAELSLRSVIRAKNIVPERENGRGRAQYPEPELRCVKSQRKMGGSRCDRVPGTGKKLYLSSVLDLFNREVIAYNLSERPVMEMVNTMLDGAFPTQTGRCSAAALGSGLALQDEELSGTFKAHGMTQVCRVKETAG